MKRTNPTLYIIKQQPDGPYKVGISYNPRKRLEQIQTANPSEVTLEEIIRPGVFSAKTIETKAHEILERYRVRGEWFDAPLKVIQEAVIQAKRSTDKRFIQPVSIEQATPSWADKEAIQNMEVEARRLSSMSGFQFRVDYIVPRNHHSVCGLHVEHNFHIVSKAHHGRYDEEKWSVPENKHEDPKSIVLATKNSTSRYDAIIARDPILTKWVIDQTTEHPGLPFKQRIHIALTGDNPICEYGKMRKFRKRYMWCHLGDYCRCKNEEKIAKKRFTTTR